MALTASIVYFSGDMAEISFCLNELSKMDIFQSLILVDNSPTGIAYQKFKTTKNVFAIRCSFNPGYGTAHNIAFRLAETLGATRHLVLNSDVKFISEDLLKLIAHLDANPQTGLVVPAILSSDFSRQYTAKLLPNLITMFVRAFLKKTNFGKEALHAFELRDLYSLKTFFAPYVSGCFMLFDLARVNSIGGFDERIFMYAEDIDISRRMSAVSDVTVLTDVEIVHYHGEATRKSWRMFMIHTVNLLYYFVKYGCFFDRERDQLNKKCRAQFKGLQG